MSLRYLVVCAVLCLPPTLFAFDSAPGPALSIQATARILDEATWGPNFASFQDLSTNGLLAWIDNQVAAPLSDLPDQPRLQADGITNNNNLAPVQLAFFQNTLYGEDQLRQRVAFALTEIWVVSDLDTDNASAFAPYWRIFRDNAFTNYETLMKAITLSPAMGRYLNMVNNNKANLTKGTAANENYSRELMQLFTLGLTQLNLDGTPIFDSNNLPVPTYTPATVTNLANALTGWTYAPMPGAANKSNNPTYYMAPMVATEANHDVRAKTLFGTTLPAGQSAAADLDQALHLIFLQPSLPPFVSQQLIQHLVTSNPSADYISRVASVFVDNGSGVRGDMKAVITAILTDPEARALDQPGSVVPSNYGHLREPVLLIANLLRTLYATITPGSTVQNQATNLGQQLFTAPSVFSYFSPQYRTREGLLGPEFQIYSTQTAANRANLINALVYGGQFDKYTKVDLSTFVYAAQNSYLMLYLNELFFHGTMSSSLQAAIQSATDAVSAPTDKAKAAVYVALTSNEYQVIH